MKTRITLLFAVILFLLQGYVYAQTIVSTTVGPRNAVLEEFTGINCPNCPDGHVRAEALAAAHPGRVVLINVHTGSFANPSAGQPDFRTPYGPALDAFAGVAAYPSGTMNRVVWPGAYNVPPYYPQNPPNNLAIRRPGWWEPSYPGQGCGEYIILNGGNSPVNIGCATTWNETTRELSILVELYYTADDSVIDNKLNVVFTENNVIGYQSGGSANYNHKHILREMITGQWGELVNPTSAGTFISRNYVYTVPAGYNVDNCDISVFVTRDNNKHTHTGIVIPAKNGSTVGLEDPKKQALTFSIFPNPATAESIIYFSSPYTEKIQFDLFDLTGQNVGTYSVAGTSGANHSIRLSDITSNLKLVGGIYMLSMTSGELHKSIKINMD